jgi:hypothetical protein
VNNIVQQICEQFTSDVVGFFASGSIKNIEEMETTLKRKSYSFNLAMMAAYITSLDQAIVEDKAGRREKGLVIERKDDKREIYTTFGQLSFTRTYFKDKPNHNYVYLLDQAVGLESYDRVSGTVAVELVEHAQEASYGESSRHVTDETISRQTVMKKIHSVKDLKIEPPSDKRNVKILHVDADEDHVPLQNGRNAIVPLICVYEGVKYSGKRGQCINPHYISSYGKTSEELWLETVDWIYSSYDVDNIERVYLHGDGASWIKEGLNWLPKAKLVLDKYHLRKSILSATGRDPEAREAIYSAVLNDDRKAFNHLGKQLLKNADSETETERIKDCLRYLRNNWEAITIYHKEACGGSCTEGHVSHVLSSRLSSRPMGWSRKGLKQMAELRAFYSSGGRIRLEHLQHVELKHSVSKRAAKKAASAFHEATMEKRGNVTILNKGKVVPMFHCLNGLRNGNGDL